MNESGFYKDLKKCFGTEWFPIRLESPLTMLGIPDLLYCYRSRLFLIELKYLKNWPKRTTTKINLKVSKFQKVLLRTLRKMGAPAYLLVRIENDVLLIEPLKDFENCTRESLFSCCIMCWINRQPEELLEVIYERH